LDGREAAAGVSAGVSEVSRRLQLAARGRIVAVVARPARRRSDQRVVVGVELSSTSRSPRGSSLTACQRTCIKTFCGFLGRPFVKRFALCYRTVVLSVCPVCLSVALVDCGQTVGWIKMKLGTEVGLDPGDIVLDGAQLPQKGAQQPTSAAAKLLFLHSSVATQVNRASLMRPVVSSAC